MNEKKSGRYSKPSTAHMVRQMSVFVVFILAVVPGVLALSPGEVLEPNVFPAVGQLKAAPPYVSSCTATLIDYNLVLTAAHCVCEPDKFGNCATRATFHFPPPYDITIPGTVRVHPDFGLRRWLNEDLAVVHLDYPTWQKIGIAPIPVESPGKPPVAGAPLHVVGFGRTGSNCRGPGAKKLIHAAATEVNSARIMIKEPGKRSCPGDSGGPILNQYGRLVGVMSWAGEEINGRPTYANHNFIFGLLGPSYIEDRW